MISVFLRQKIIAMQVDHCCARYSPKSCYFQSTVHLHWLERLEKLVMEAIEHGFVIMRSVVRATQKSTVWKDVCCGELPGNKKILHLLF